MNQPVSQLSATSGNEVQSGISSAEVTKAKRQAPSNSGSLVDTAISTIHDQPVATVQTLPPVPYDDAFEESATHMLKQVDHARLNPVTALETCPQNIVRFINFANSVLTHGLVCSTRARALSIQQISSLDKNPRPANEVEVNCVFSPQGLIVALESPAKGAWNIALERKNDPVPNLLIPLGLTSEERDRLANLPSHLRAIFEKQLLQQKPPGFPPEALSVLTERSHYAMLLLFTPANVDLRDNDNNILPKTADPMVDLRKICKEEATDGCREVKILANVSPTSFGLVILSDRFLAYSHLINYPSEKLVFVPSATQRVYYNYTPSENTSNRTVVSAEVNISCPNFIDEARKFLDQAPLFGDKKPSLMHLSKGPAPGDPF